MLFPAVPARPASRRPPSRTRHRTAVPREGAVARLFTPLCASLQADADGADVPHRRPRDCEGLRIGVAMEPLPATTAIDGWHARASRHPARPRLRGENAVYATTLVDALKRILKGKGITYATVAAGARIERSERQADVLAARVHAAAARGRLSRCRRRIRRARARGRGRRGGHRASHRRAGGGNRLRPEAHAGRAVRGGQLDVRADRRHLRDVGCRMHRLPDASRSATDHRAAAGQPDPSADQPHVLVVARRADPAVLPRARRVRISVVQVRPAERALSVRQRNAVAAQHGRGHRADAQGRRRFRRAACRRPQPAAARAPRHEPARRDPPVGAARVSQVAPRRARSGAGGPAAQSDARAQVPPRRVVRRRGSAPRHRG